MKTIFNSLESEISRLQKENDEQKELIQEMNLGLDVNTEGHREGLTLILYPVQIAKYQLALKENIELKAKLNKFNTWWRALKAWKVIKK